VVVLNCKEGSSKVISTIKERSDMIIGAGYGKLKETQIRIANFPAVNFDQVQSLITELGSL
jgi:phosphoserine aminotransferase